MTAWEREMRACLERARREAEIGNDGIGDYLQFKIARMEKALDGFKNRERARRRALKRETGNLIAG